MKNPNKVKISTFGSQVTSAISVALVLILLGTMAMALVTADSLADNIRKNVGIVVKLMPGAPDIEIDRVQARLAAIPGIVSIDYSAPDKILEDESKLMGENLAEILDQNPFGGEFELKVAPGYVNSDSIAAMMSVFADDPRIDEIVSQTEVVDNINSILGKVSLVLLVVALALLIISFVLISNTVSLAVYSRRFIIHTMKLVGATASFIRRPFLWAGFFTGLVAAFVAIGCVIAIRTYAATFDPMVNDILVWQQMAWICGAMLVTGPLICIFASAIATNRYLKSSYDDMFK